MGGSISINSTQNICMKNSEKKIVSFHWKILRQINEFVEVDFTEFLCNSEKCIVWKFSLTEKKFREINYRKVVISSRGYY